MESMPAPGGTEIWTEDTGGGRSVSTCAASGARPRRRSTIVIVGGRDHKPALECSEFVAAESGHFVSVRVPELVAETVREFRGSTIRVGARHYDERS